METVKKIEVKFAEWYKTLPHLPEGGRKWLATNLWWIVLIGVILLSIGIVSLIGLTFFAGALLGAYGGAIGAIIGGIAILAVLVALAFMSIVVVLGAMAISPLKSMKRKGWTLLFIIMLIQILEYVISFLFDWNLFGLIWNLFCVGVGGYFLFEVRDFYGKAFSAPKAPLPTPTSNADGKA